MSFWRKKRLILVFLVLFLILILTTNAQATSGTVEIRAPDGTVPPGASNTCYGEDFSCPVSYSSCPQQGCYSAWFTADSESTSRHAYCCPTGWLDAASSTSVSGWSCDQDSPTTSIDVHLYFGGPAGSGIGRAITANLASEAAVNNICGGGNAHRFNYAPDSDLLDALGPGTHNVYAYGINVGEGNNIELSGSPKSFDCPCCGCISEGYYDCKTGWCGKDNTLAMKTNDASCTNWADYRFLCSGTTFYECDPDETWGFATDSSEGNIHGSYCCEFTDGANGRWNTYQSPESSCSDGIDNDCDGSTDCADSDCVGVGNCCQNDNDCSICYTCSGNTCQAQTADNGNKCNKDCDYCSSGSCTKRSANDNTEVTTTCYYCDGSNAASQPYSGETGVSCSADCKDCVSGVCTSMTENNDGSCNDDCDSCVSGTCTDRNQCDSRECSSDKYCDSDGGDCETPDGSSSVCLNCVTEYGGDKTTGSWTSGNHEDYTDGVGWSSNADVYTTLFNSDGDNCIENDGTQCFDNIGSNVNHKSALSTGNCCGDDANEWYKYDHYGGECTSSVNDCVWGSGEGDAQTSDTGNAGWWCYLHEWYECKDSTIGTKIGGVTCAGITGNNAWTPNSLVLPEDQYSCSDNLDNDGDSKTDCQDSDCNGNIRGYVKDQDNVALDSAKVEAFQGSTWKAEAYTQPDGSYEINNINCGTYNLIASKTDYISDSKTNINLPPTTTLNNVDFTLTYGIVCEDDCSYLIDDKCHKECDGVDYDDGDADSCIFYDNTAKEKCNLAKIGWQVDYSATEFVECCEGSPKEIAEIKAFPSCPYKNLIKFHRIVYSKGKPIRLVTVVCGD